MESEFPRSIGKVATRELAASGYTRFDEIAEAAASALLRIHGVGEKSIGILREELAARGQSFADER